MHQSLSHTAIPFWLAVVKSSWHAVINPAGGGSARWRLRGLEYVKLKTVSPAYCTYNFRLLQQSNKIYILSFLGLHEI